MPLPFSYMYFKFVFYNHQIKTMKSMEVVNYATNQYNVGCGNLQQNSLLFEATNRERKQMYQVGILNNEARV